MLEMLGSIAVVAGVIGLIGELGELSVFTFFDYTNPYYQYPYVIIGVPVGIIFPGEGRLFYITNPQFAHKDGDFFPAIEIVPEFEIFYYDDITTSIFLRIRYPLIFRNKNERPCFAVTPFIEAGGSIDTELLSAGFGLIMQYRRIAIAGKYRAYYDPYYGDMISGVGLTFSCDFIRPLFNRHE